jgi:hypothetical protein
LASGIRASHPSPHPSSGVIRSESGGYRWLNGSTNLLIAVWCIRKRFIRKKSTTDQALTARLKYGSDQVLIGDVVATWQL